MEMTMIERVAKAITWADLSDEVRASFEERGITAETVYAEESMFRLAKAAIEAMRTPTPSMEDAVAKDVDDWVSERIEDMMHLYKVAIDAALKEHEGEKR
jgi:hypothetical protein